MYFQGGDVCAQGELGEVGQVGLVKMCSRWLTVEEHWKKAVAQK